MEEDIDTDNSTISNAANNVTVSDEELKEDEVMVSVLDVSDEANDTLEINADLNATAEVNSDNVDASEGNDNPEGFSTLEAANLEANHTAAETVDISVLEDDIAEAELNRTDIAEGSIDETGDFEEPLLVNSSNIEEQSPLVLDSDSDKTLSAAVQKVSIREAGMLDLQTQLYILSATFGAVIFLLILLVLVLALSVARIKEQLHARLRQDQGCPNGSRDVIGYENGGFSTAGNGRASNVNERSVDGDDLERLGYTQYRGGNRENAYKVNDPVRGEEGEIPLSDLRNSSAMGGGKPMMKYEEGVVPLGDRDPERNSNYSYR